MKFSRPILRALVLALALAAPASAFGDGWVYTESNNPDRGDNSVLALAYANNGSLNPARIREFPTRGTGAPLIPNRSVGTTAGDQQVLLSADRRWLFAVNQGSNTVAVFRVNQRTGALRHAPGSPFASGGNAPVSLGFNGRHLVVVNHGIIAPFDPGPSADFRNPNLTSFAVTREGRLRKVASIPTGPAPTAATFAPNGKSLFSTNFFGWAAPGDPSIQSFTISNRGRLAGAGPPMGFPASMYEGNPPLPPFLPPGIEKLAFGVATHPSKPYTYVLGPVNFRVAIYRYDNAGRMTFTGQEDNPGAVAACWLVLTSDGKFMYTANTFSQDISRLRVSRSGGDLTFAGKTRMPSTATPFNLAIDPDDRFLYAVGGHADPDGPRPQEVNPDGSVGAPAPADGNFIEAYQIRRNGTIRSIGTTALPVRLSQLPYGLAVVERRR